MRYQGRVLEWNAARGFGFVRGQEDGPKVLVHVTAFGRHGQPAVGDGISYRVQQDGQGRMRAIQVEPVDSDVRSATLHGIAPNARWVVAIVVVLLVAGAYAWSRYSHNASENAVHDAVSASASPATTRPSVPVDTNKATPNSAEAAGSPPAQGAPQPASDAAAGWPLAAPVHAPAFTCAGKRYCSQMSSCAEATFYLQHCPGTLQDGDGDGIPCEDQWCGH